MVREWGGSDVIALLSRCLSVPRNKADRGAERQAVVGGVRDEKQQHPVTFFFCFFKQEGNRFVP